MAFIIVGGVLGLYMAWTIGANDVANSMADAVGSKSCTIRQAVIAAGICELAGAVLVGAHVTDTIRKGIVSSDALTSLPNVSEHEAAAMLVLGMICALLGAAIWLHLASWFGMPVSTTHSIVGAVAGFGILSAGWSAVQWGKMGQIVASWVISPVAGGIVSFLLFKLMTKFILGSYRPARAATRYGPFFIFLTFFVITVAIVFKGLKHVIAADSFSWLTGYSALYVAGGVGVAAALISRWYLRRNLMVYGKEELEKQLHRVEKVFMPLVFISSCTVAFAHGSNDVANAVGPLAAVVEVMRTGDVSMEVPVPVWVLALGGCGITAGLAIYGYRVMTTVGSKITEITPSRGMAADIGAMMTVLVCSRLELPVSTTHTLVGAILGVALARGLGAVNRGVVRNIFGSWLITVPVAAVFTIVLFLIASYFWLDTIMEMMPS